MHRPTKALTGAVASSIVSACILMAIIYSAAIGTRNDLISIMQFTALLAVTVSTIVHWVTYLRAYVDFAIERKLIETARPETD